MGMTEAADNCKYNKAIIQTTTVQQRQNTCADEDLFVRAAELNNSAPILTNSEVKFEPQSTENSQGNIYTTTCSD